MFVSGIALTLLITNAILGVEYSTQVPLFFTHGLVDALGLTGSASM